jgi:hypothetical protein
MKLKTSIVPEWNRHFLTAEKEYEVTDVYVPYGAYIVDDMGHSLHIFIGKPCILLAGKYWDLVQE